MPQTRSKATAPQPDNWAQRWEAALQSISGEQRPAGEGWKSITDLTADMGLTRDGVVYHMRRSVDAGRIEVAYGRSTKGQRVAFYRPVVKSETTPPRPPPSRALGSRC